MVSKETPTFVRARLAELDTRRDGTADVRDVKELLRSGLEGFPEEALDSFLSEVTRNGDRVDLGQLVDSAFQGLPGPNAWAVPVRFERSTVREFMELGQQGKVQAEYVWLDSDYSDGRSFDLCSKGMTLDEVPRSVDDLPVWTYSGADDIDVHMVPRQIYKDPFRRGDNILVLVDTYFEPEPGSGQSHGKVSSWNTRAACEEAMARAKELGDDPWFGIEQEYYLLDLETNWPLGWPRGGFPGKHEYYYCATGAGKTVGRDIVECHYRACLYAGVKMGGVNSEVAPGQWEFQVGPCSGTRAADDLWMARYLLQRVCEMFHVYVTFDPKPVPGWAGIGCHTNYSTRDTRAEGGVKAMEAQIEKLRLRHTAHLAVYGDGNERRLTGKDCTMSMDKFKWGHGRENISIRIPVKVAAKGCGYYEDRRPAANMDPYLVTRMLVETTLLFEPSGGAEEPHMVRVPVRRASSKEFRCHGSTPSCSRPNSAVPDSRAKPNPQAPGSNVARDS